MERKGSAGASLAAANNSSSSQHFVSPLAHLSGGIFHFSKGCIVLPGASIVIVRDSSSSSNPEEDGEDVLAVRFLPYTLVEEYAQIEIHPSSSSSSRHEVLAIGGHTRFMSHSRVLTRHSIGSDNIFQPYSNVDLVTASTSSQQCQLGNRCQVSPHTTVTYASLAGSRTGSSLLKGEVGQQQPVLLDHKSFLYSEEAGVCVVEVGGIRSQAEAHAWREIVMKQQQQQQDEEEEGREQTNFASATSSSAPQPFSSSYSQEIRRGRTELERLCLLYYKLYHIQGEEGDEVEGCGGGGSVEA